MNNILFNLAIEPFGTGIGEYYIQSLSSFLSCIAKIHKVARKHNFIFSAHAFLTICRTLKKGGLIPYLAVVLFYPVSAVAANGFAVGVRRGR